MISQVVDLDGARGGAHATHSETMSSSLMGLVKSGVCKELDDMCHNYHGLPVRPGVRYGEVKGSLRYSLKYACLSVQFWYSGRYIAGIYALSISYECRRTRQSNYADWDDARLAMFETGPWLADLLDRVQAIESARIPRILQVRRFRLAF